MTEDTVTISRKEYEELVKDSNFLGALEAAGVDNWQGYDDARDIYREMLEEGE